MPEIFQIPFEDNFVLYRPLLGMGLMANAALANVVAGYFSGDESAIEVEDGARSIEFLKGIGFLEADPPPPPAMNLNEYKPVCTTLFLTNRCNLRCTYCYASGGEEPFREMPIELAKKCIDAVYGFAKEKKAKSFQVGFHGGGEPTVNWETFTIAVVYARSKDLKSEISTASNGVFGPDRAKWIVDNLDGVNLSFDGPPEIQNAQRLTASGGDSFGSVMKTIDYFDKAKFPYAIRMTVTEETIPAMAGSVKFVCENSGVRLIQVEPAFPQGRAGKKWICEKSVDEFIEQFKEAYCTAEKLGVELYYSGARPMLITTAFCRAGDDALIVSPTGEVSACFEVYGENHPMAGHFFFGRFDENGILVINNDKRRGLLKDRNPEKLEYCSECFCRWHCAGDCLSKTFSTTDDRNFSASPRCKINMELTSFLLLKKIAAGGGVWKDTRRHRKHRRTQK